MNNGSQNKKSRVGVWIAAILIVIVALVLIFGTKKKDVEETPVVSDTTQTTPDQDVNESEPTSPEKALTYAQALAKYQGKRLQFTADCQATPDRQTFKAGTSIMLDNRAPKALNVKVGSTYTLGKYGFRIITLNTIGTFLVDCGTSQNVATITVQK